MVAEIKIERIGEIFMPEDNVLMATINGVSYTLRGKEPVAHLQAIIDLVNEKYASIKREHPDYPSHKISTLVSLQLADELLYLQKDYRAMLAEAGRP